MARFKLVRQREADGTVDHVLEFFLVGADGHPLLECIGDEPDPERVASDMRRAAAGGTVTASGCSKSLGYDIGARILPVNCKSFARTLPFSTRLAALRKARHARAF
jgi:hypothetical protein